MSLSKLMNMFADAGNMFASPSLVLLLSYAVSGLEARIVGRSPSSGRWPRSCSFEATAVAAPAEVASTARPRTSKPASANGRRIAPDSRRWRFARASRRSIKMADTKAAAERRIRHQDAVGAGTLAGPDARVVRWLRLRPEEGRHPLHEIDLLGGRPIGLEREREEHDLICAAERKRVGRCRVVGERDERSTVGRH